MGVPTPGTRHDHHVRAGGHAGQLPPERFPQAPPDAVAHHRSAQPAPHREADPDGRPLAPEGPHRHQVRRASAPRPEDPVEVAPQGEPVEPRRPPSGLQRTVKRARPLARRRFNTLRPPGVDIRRRNPCTRRRWRRLRCSVLFIGYPNSPEPLRNGLAQGPRGDEGLLAPKAAGLIIAFAFSERQRPPRPPAAPRTPCLAPVGALRLTIARAGGRALLPRHGVDNLWASCAKSGPRRMQGMGDALHAGCLACAFPMPAPSLHLAPDLAAGRALPGGSRGAGLRP